MIGTNNFMKQDTIKFALIKQANSLNTGHLSFMQQGPVVKRVPSVSSKRYLRP